MAKKRCPRPVNRLVMHRLKLPSGPMLQNACNAYVHSMGNYYGIGGPGSGVSAISGFVLDANTIQVRFSACVSISANTGIQYQIDGGSWVTVTGSAKVSDAVWNCTTGVAIQAGDDVRWRYTGGSNSIVDCADAEDIGDQEIVVNNPLTLAGNFVLLSVGGKEITLLSNDVAQTEGVQTSDA